MLTAPVKYLGKRHLPIQYHV